MKIRYNGPLQVMFHLKIPTPLILERYKNYFRPNWRKNWKKLKNEEKETHSVHSPNSSWRSDSTPSKACSPSKSSRTSAASLTTEPAFPDRAEGDASGRRGLHGALVMLPARLLTRVSGWDARGVTKYQANFIDRVRRG